MTFEKYNVIRISNDGLLRIIEEEQGQKTLQYWDQEAGLWIKDNDLMPGLSLDEEIDNWDGKKTGEIRHI